MRERDGRSDARSRCRLDETGRDDEAESPKGGQTAVMAAPQGGSDWLAVETSQHRWRHPVAPPSSAITKRSLSH